MEIADYFRIFRRRWLVIAAAVVVCVALATLATVLQTKEYASSARLFVSTAAADDANTVFQSGQFSQQRVQSYAELVSSRQLAASVIQDLSLTATPADLASRVTAEGGVGTVNLTITATDTDPHRAQRIAQAYAENLADMVRELETPPGQETAPIKATIVDNASFSDSAVAPKPVQNIGMGLIFGLLLGVAVAVLRDRLDTTVKNAEDATRTTGSALLGTIAYDAGARTAPLVTALNSHAPRVEAFRVLRTNMQFIDVDSADKVFVVTSSLPGEGKTTTSLNLAITMAQAGQRTLLIEADLRRPKAAVELGLDNAVGVTTVLVGKVGLQDAIQKHPETDLHLLASGAVPPNPAELLQSKSMAELLADARQQYDVVIIDAPPLLPVTDAALLAAQSDGALVIVRHGKTTREQLAQAMKRLEQVDARSVGVVLNMVPAGRRAGGYGYGYGYGYAPESPDETKSTTPREN